MHYSKYEAYLYICAVFSDDLIVNITITYHNNIVRLKTKRIEIKNTNRYHVENSYEQKKLNRYEVLLHIYSALINVRSQTSETLF